MNAPTDHTQLPALITPWFDRTFDLTFPPELQPNLCARLRGTPARLEEVLQNHTRAALIRKPQHGSTSAWSAQEHAGHLLDLEPLWLARLNDYLAGATELTLADLTNRRTHEANHNAAPLDEILIGFRDARTRLLALAQSLDPALWTRAIPHPRLKTPLRLVDHLHFVAEHDDHHLAHIWHLLTH